MRATDFIFYENGVSQGRYTSKPKLSNVQEVKFVRGSPHPLRMSLSAIVRLASTCSLRQTDQPINQNRGRQATVACSSQALRGSRLVGFRRDSDGVCARAYYDRYYVVELYRSHPCPFEFDVCEILTSVICVHLSRPLKSVSW